MYIEITGQTLRKRMEIDKEVGGIPYREEEWWTSQHLEKSGPPVTYSLSGMSTFSVICPFQQCCQRFSSTDGTSLDFQGCQHFLPFLHLMNVVQRLPNLFGNGKEADSGAHHLGQAWFTHGPAPDADQEHDHPEA